MAPTELTRVGQAFGGVQIDVAVDRMPAGRPSLWPSVGEYPVYDPFLYGVMSTDELRNREFRRARQVFAIEALDES